MTEHTPGPWEFRKQPYEPWTIYANGESIMGNESYYPWVPDKEADWHLIAAAPELLEALRMFVVWYGLRDKHDTLLPPKEQEAELAQAMRAIAKATGAPE